MIKKLVMGVLGVLGALVAGLLGGCTSVGERCLAESERAPADMRKAAYHRCMDYWTAHRERRTQREHADDE